VGGKERRNFKSRRLHGGSRNVMEVMLKNDNNKVLNYFIDELELSEYQSNIDIISKKILDLNYRVCKTDSLMEACLIPEIFTTMCHCRPSLISEDRKIIIHPNIKDGLGENVEFIWILLHELGHAMTVGVRVESRELREVIAWEMAYAMIKTELPLLNGITLINSFKKVSINSLKAYWERRGSKWHNKYEWVEITVDNQILLELRSIPFE
jgi:hypothetical protein